MTKRKRQISKKEAKLISTLESYIYYAFPYYENTTIDELVKQAHEHWDDGEYKELHGIMAYLLKVMSDQVSQYSVQ